MTQSIWSRVSPLPLPRSPTLLHAREKIPDQSHVVHAQLPNEEQHTSTRSPSVRSAGSAASSTSTSRNRQAAASSASSVHHAPTASSNRTASPRGPNYSQHAPQQHYHHHQASHSAGGHFVPRDFAPSPRSSASTSGGSFPPTPDSSTSPHDRNSHNKALAPIPPGSVPPGPPVKRFSPNFSSSSLGLYQDSVNATGDPVASSGTGRECTPYLGCVRCLERFQPLTEKGTAAAVPPTPAPSSATPSSQPLLAEVFSGNPRPHYRPSLSTSALAPHQQYRPNALPGGSVSVGASPYPLQSPALAPSPAHQEPSGVPSATPSYFSSPPSGSIHGRGRSASIAVIDRSSNVMPSSTSTQYSHGYPDAYAFGDYGGGDINGNGADQHGWKPSGSGSGNGHISASLPTVSAVGSPTRGSLLPHPSSSSVARGGGPSAGGAYSPFGWNEDSGPLPGSSDREGRSRFRDLWGNGASGAGGAGSGLSTSAGSTGGIGMSNMSPFSRDGSKLELDSSWGGLSSLKNGPGPYTGGGPHGRLLREHSLGAVGTGRKRSDAALWGRPTLLREVEDEDRSEDDADVFHPPTKSGATSRRHSFAAFDPPNRGSTTQTGFHLPSTSSAQPTTISSGFGPLLAPVTSSAWSGPGNGGGGYGGSAINDDDLAADLNSLHLNLEAAAASQAPPRAASKHLHVGSMPADFPPARGSRALEHSRSPPPREMPAEVKVAPAHTQPQPQGSSPRATAEPFTPSLSSSVGSRFFLQGLQNPTPLPPATTPVVATASPGLGGNSIHRYDSPLGSQQYQNQPNSGGSSYGQFGGSMPPPVPPVTTQHQYFTPVTGAPSALSPRGVQVPPPPPPPGPFPGFGPGLQPSQHLAGLMSPPPPPPPQPPLSYFNAPPPPPPGMPQLGGMVGPAALAQTDMNLGRGVPLHAIPPGSPLCIVGFKAGRKDLFFCEDPNLRLEEGDLVIVEADRGRDVGKFLKSVTVDEVHKFQQHLVELALGQLASGGSAGMTGPASMGMGMGVGSGMGYDPNAGVQSGTAQLARMTKECQPKRIFAKAGPADTHALLSKAQDEVKALALVRSKVVQKGAFVVPKRLARGV